MDVKTIFERLRHGEVEIQELIESLRRFPQTAKVRTKHGMLSVKFKDKLHFLNEEYEEWPSGINEA